jgi:hypothetical protein
MCWNSTENCNLKDNISVLSWGHEYQVKKRRYTFTYSNVWLNCTDIALQLWKHNLTVSHDISVLQQFQFKTLKLLQEAYFTHTCIDFLFQSEFSSQISWSVWHISAQICCLQTLNYLITFVNLILNHLDSYTHIICTVFNVKFKHVIHCPRGITHEATQDWTWDSKVSNDSQWIYAQTCSHFVKTVLRIYVV